MKKFMSILLAIIMVFSMSATVFAADFTDTADNRHYEAIETLHALGMISGYDGETYGPEDELTRAQACAIIIRAIDGEPRDYYNQIFTDVPTSHWAADYIAEAYNRGYVSGYGNNMFGPEDKVTYDQMSKIMLNVIGYRNTGDWPTGLRQVAKNAGLYENCIITDGTANCTRGAVAQMVYNAFDCKTIDNNGFPTGKTFMDSLGFKVVDDTWQIDANDKFTGHKVVTYKNGKTIVPTSVITTNAVSATYINDTTMKVGTKSYPIEWSTTELFVDGKDANSFPAGIKTVQLIFNSDEEIIAVVAETPIKIQTFPVGTFNQWIPQAEINDIKGYIEGISTVTKIGDEYKVSNDTYVGFVIDAWSTASNYWAEFSDGKIMKFDDAWNFTCGKLVIIFYDYEGNPNSYQCVN